MSRKKKKNLQTGKIISFTNDKEKEVNTSETKEVVPAGPSKKEQIARMLFEDFFKNALKVFNYFENDMITIVPYMEKDGEEKNDGSDIVCYEICPKSNANVLIYLDHKDVCVSLKNVVVNLDDDELAYLAANILGYVKKGITEKAA